LKLRRPDTCVVCARALIAGEIAVWDPARRNARCVGCEVGAAPVESSAGASALREYERRRDHRAVRDRERFGRLGPVISALRSEPQHEIAWRRGAEGEIKVAYALERAIAQGVVALHDRRMPGSRGNIDHIAIGPAGVTVIDAKRYRGMIEVERRGGLLQERTEHLVVGGRDCTKLVDGVLAQAEAVRQIVGDGPHSAVPVRALLCFVDGDWPWSGRLEVRGVPVVAPRRAAKLCATGPCSAVTVTAIADALAARLPPA
jgi:nuclease-like protein